VSCLFFSFPFFFNVCLLNLHFIFPHLFLLLGKFCNWADEIRNTYHLKINQPKVQCTIGRMETDKNHTNNNNNSNNATVTQLQLPCLRRPLVFHHHNAVPVLTKEHSPGQLYHLCEYMLLIDKTKSPEMIHTLWNSASQSNHFHDFSEVFRNDKEHGWLRTMEKFHAEEIACEAEHSSDHRRAEFSQSKEAYPCLLEMKERRRIRRNLRRNYHQISFRDYFDEGVLSVT
jgi:hypothetical protein